MVVTIKTKISDIIKENEKAIEVISSINSHFRKLRNPILRKLLASKVTLGQAARIGNVSSEVMLSKLKEIGFDVSYDPLDVETHEVKKIDMMVQEDKLRVLDVRSYISSGKDPFSLIMKEVKNLPDDHTLLIINTFEPVPLISLLASQGFNSHVVKESEELYKTYFQRTNKEHTGSVPGEREEFAYTDLLEEYKGRLKEIDVREMEMPYPMITILNELAELEKEYALLVHHKRVPKFLLPKLDEMGTKYAFKSIADDFVMMIISKE